MPDDEETWDPEATTSTGSGAPKVDPGLLVGRYVVGDLLGRGASGQVHRATDTLTGEDVAVKFVRALSPADRRQLRRELVALRLLDLPGVARLLDDGVERGQTFLVMELLPGGPFSRLAGPYERWAPAARALVETLARVHYAGVIHRDLKPGNILLDAADRPVITDFGLAQGTSVEVADGTLEGTPRYMPPEQWAGRPCDERSDLYSLGALLWELAVGEPFPQQGRERVLEADVPEALREMILRLISADPRDRPASAEEVLEALGGGDAVLGPLPPLPNPVTREALEALVDEPRASFLHLAEDTASLLVERSDGDPERVRALLASWIRAGRCHWHEGRLRMDRAAIAALRWEQAGIPVVDEALQASEAAWKAGDPGRSLAILESVLPLLDDEATAAPVRHRLAARAQTMNDPALLRRVLYLAERAGDAPLTALLQGARLCLSQEMQRAAAILRQTGDLPEELEFFRVFWLAHALGRVDREEQAQVLAEVESWCRGDEIRRGQWLAARGRAAYAAGRYAEALADHEAAAALLADLPVVRLSSLVNAAAAALETMALDHAADLATEARDLARDVRHAVMECFAANLARMAGYRSGRLDAPRIELVDAASAVSPAHEAQHAVTEGAIAWRAGHPAAPSLALRAARIYGQLAYTDGQALALGLAAAAGAPVDATEVARLAGQAGDPTLALQAVALGARTEAASLPIEGWLAAWYLPDPEARADVLSLTEIRARL